MLPTFQVDTDYVNATFKLNYQSKKLQIQLESITKRINCYNHNSTQYNANNL